VRRLAQLMHGDVRVRNLPGKGSAFTVTLRLHAAGADDVVPLVATPQGLAALDASGGRVLVADDHPVNRQVLQGQLALLGLAVDTATDGMHALSLWQPGRYAVVLADMHMPRLDGYGLTAEIRAREAASRVSRTPIVAVTANATRGEEEHCLAAGMDAYLAKPVTLEGLGATLGRWITVTLPDEPLVPSVDRGLLRNWLGDDEAAVRSLLAEFLANARDNARDVEAALSEGDMSALAFAVHKLKGGALSIGAHELQRLAAALEVAARRGDDAACRHMLGTLAHALERTAADIGA